MTAIDGGFVLRVNGPFTLAPGESVDSVVVVKGDALIGGTVHDTLVVINGHADIAGRVEGNVTIVKGDVTLEGGSFVSRVTIINGSVTPRERLRRRARHQPARLRLLPGALLLAVLAGNDHRRRDCGARLRRHRRAAALRRRRKC